MIGTFYLIVNCYINLEDFHRFDSHQAQARFCGSI